MSLAPGGGIILLLKLRSVSYMETAKVYLAEIAVERPEAGATLPAKFLRLLDRCGLAAMVKDRGFGGYRGLGTGLS